MRVRMPPKTITARKLRMSFRRSEKSWKYRKSERLGIGFPGSTIAPAPGQVNKGGRVPTPGLTFPNPLHIVERYAEEIR
jgi:hypothetical protein